MSRRIIVDILGDSSGFTKATKDATATAYSFGNVLQGIGQSIGHAGFNLLHDAVAQTTQFVKDSVVAFREEEAGIARLGASLRANVDDWDGNTDAIERTVKAAMNMSGFSDDAIRESLSRLVASTHDVSAAFKLQATAMDLARFKGISLEDASVALIKVEGGQYRALKELGIVLKAGASQTDALAAVQRVAGGQMAAYMDTAQGKTEALANRIDNLQEALGERLSPALEKATLGAINFLDALDSDAPLTLDQRTRSLADVLNAINPITWAVSGSMDDLRAKQEELANKVTPGLIGNFGRVGRVMRDVGSETTTTTGRMVDGAKAVAQAYGRLATTMLGQYTTDFQKALDITDARATLSAARGKKITTDLLVDKAKAYETLAGLNALSSKDYDNWLKTVEALAKGTKGKVHEAYEAAIRDIEALRDAARKAVHVNVFYVPHGAIPADRNAAGGPVSGLSWVGENGPELAYFPPGSRVYSNAESMRMASSGGGGGGGAQVINVNFHGPVYGDDMDDLSRRLAMRLRTAG